MDRGDVYLFLFFGGGGFGPLNDNAGSQKADEVGLEVGRACHVGGKPQHFAFE